MKITQLHVQSFTTTIELSKPTTVKGGFITQVTCISQITVELICATTTQTSITSPGGGPS